MTNTISYIKVDAADPNVQTLATKLNVPASQVASMINGQRYRAAYNKQKNASLKDLRDKVKELQAELAKQGGKA